jgi:hypothetical protein
MRKFLLAALVAGIVSAAAVATGGAGLASGQGSNGPTGPTGATTPKSAGTIQSFTNGVLTIKLNDGSMVSGMVTDATRINGAMAPGSDDNDADDNGQGGRDQGGGDDKGRLIRHWFDRHKNGCTTNALASGVVVIAADLAITPSGSFFTKVILMSCPSTGATSTSSSSSTSTSSSTTSTSTSTSGWTGEHHHRGG